MNFSDDTTEFLFLLNKNSVEYLIVGGEAVIFYGYPRLTGDIDVFYNNTEKNAKQLFSTLLEFWNNNIPGITNYEILLKKDSIIQFGFPPNRLDLINSIDGIEFEECWENRHSIEYNINNKLVLINYISINDLIKNKKASGRNKDLADVEYLEKILENR